MAFDLTGISNVNEFYSHHYLDSLLEGDLKGLYKKWQENEERSPYEKLSGIAQKYFRAKTDAFNEKKPEDRVEVTNKFNINFLESLGYNVQQKVKFTEDGQALPVLTTVSRDGIEHLWVIETVFWADDVSIFEQPLVFNNLDDEDNWFDDSVDTAIQEIFRLDEPPRWLILLAGQKVYLIDRNKWGHGKYLLFDLDEIFGRKQNETLKATAALLSKDALAPEEGNILHDELDENSHKHAFSVSEDLKYGIRRAVELIGNEFILYRSKVAKQKIYGDEELANKLTKECLNYLYRLLFLFYAESRSEQLNVVPMKSEEYRLGYSLETLRELELVPLTTEASREGYFLHESLTTLFKIVNEGFGNDDQFEMDYEGGNYVDFGFVIDSLQSPLFDPIQTPLLSSVKFRNFVLQEVIQLLSLSKEGSKQRGRISYAQLGINQLGAVYEGLLSYSGFFAQETLYEVKPADVNSTDETGQSYFVPESEISQYKDDEFVLFKDDDGINRRKRYEKGSFIFRLAGRDREKSASYYTPEVLTQSLVKYSLKELLKDKSADEILELTICEPAMGSGAFLNEAINQLADAYLERKQKELGVTINPERYTHEKQRVKAYLATNNIYGVDLNSTAVELAKVSLWLNTIYEGSLTPWFSAKLSVGNSLIGAKNSVYKIEEFMNGSWKNKRATPLKLSTERKSDQIYEFLLPLPSSILSDYENFISKSFPNNLTCLKEWKEEFFSNFEVEEIDTLKNLSNRVDNLWRRHISNKNRLLDITSETIDVWGQQYKEKKARNSSIENKEKKLMELKQGHSSPYKALKLIMDYWCSFWFWPIDKIGILPSTDEFLLDLSVILDSAETFGTNIDELVNSIDRLGLVKEISDANDFLHWELEFTEIFSKNNGFDIILGNPPWTQINWNEKGLLSESFPLFSLRKFNSSEVSTYKEDLLKGNSKIFKNYLNEYISQSGYKSFVSTNYPLLKGSKANAYKAFICKSFDIGNSNSIIGLIHDKGIFEDKHSEDLRSFLYKKLEYYFHYHNELRLFKEIGHAKKFEVTISRKSKSSIDFRAIFNLYHPSTIDKCFSSSSMGQVPGIKNEDGKWNLNGHKSRVVNIQEKELEIFAKLLDDNNPMVTRLPIIHSKEVLSVIKKFENQDIRLNSYEDNYYLTTMFDETQSQRKKIIKKSISRPDKLENLVLSGPHYYVGNPLNKEPRENCKSKGDYDTLDLTTIGEDFIPRTIYTATDITNERIPVFQGKKITEYYRYVNRSMASPTNERTLITALLPKKVSHTNASVSITFADETLMLLFLGLSHSIVFDFFIRTTGKSNIYSDVLGILPIPKVSDSLQDHIISRVLRLNCLTSYYRDIWNNSFKNSYKACGFAKKDHRLSEFSELSQMWSEICGLRNYFERRQALLELDVLAAISLGLTIEELITIYRVQFSTLKNYDEETFYDQEGKIIFTINRGLADVGLKRKDWEQIKDLQNKKELPDDCNKFSPPFEKFDRELDMRQAYEYFSKILEEEKAKGEINV